MATTTSYTHQHSLVQGMSLRESGKDTFESISSKYTELYRTILQIQLTSPFQPREKIEYTVTPWTLNKIALKNLSTLEMSI